MNDNIWQSTDKKPKHDHRIIINYSMDMYRDNGWDENDNWDKFVVDNQVNKWCYLDDLLKQSEELERYKKALTAAIEHLDKRGYGDNYVYACIKTKDKITNIIKETKE